MSKKPVSEKRAEREREENLTLSRVFHVFLLGLAAECYLFLVYRGYNMGSVDSLLIWHQILTWGTWIGLVMAIAAVAVGFVKRQDQRRDDLGGRHRAVSGGVRLGGDPLL